MVSVSNVNSVNNSIYQKANADDVKNLLKYVNGETIAEQADTFASTVKGSIPAVGIFEGVPLAKLLKRNKKISGSLVNDAMKNLQASNKESFVKLLKGEKKLADYIIDAEKSKEAYSAIKSATKKEFQEKGFSKLYNAKQAIKASKPMQKVKVVKDTASKGIKKLFGQVASDTAESVAEKTLEKTVNIAEKAGVKSSSKLSKLLKSSNAVFMLAISGFMELMTEVLPTYKQLGTEKGTKQAVKSAIRVVGDTAGFIGGEYAGTAIGAAIGSVVPVVGTALGAAVGFVGGLVGSYVMGRITRKITGPTELEKFKEAQQQEQAGVYQYDEKALSELKELAVQKLEKEYELTGTLSKDSQIALNSYKNLNALNVFA